MEDSWRMPEFTVEGQAIFWDAQASVYEHADMTTDNREEIECVIAFCKEIACREIITLGGAVGCRDPKMILEALFPERPPPPVLPKVIFNDLSVAQVEWAKNHSLKSFTNAGGEVSYLPGEIKEICKAVPARIPRRLLLGVYNCQSFFEAKPSSGYPLCGFDEYLKNCHILGNNFLMEWVRYVPKEGIVPTHVRSHVSSFDNEDLRAVVKNALQVFHKSMGNNEFKNVIALQIVGRSKNRDGFFLSHWYTPQGFRGMLNDVFPESAFSVKELHVAKGMVYVIDPIGCDPQGVITVLNNVVGNVLPHSQLETLNAIKNLVSM